MIEIEYLNNVNQILVNKPKIQSGIIKVTENENSGITEHNNLKY